MFKYKRLFIIMSRFLSYGDFVYITFISDNLNKKQFITSNGFLEKNLLLRDQSQLFRYNFRNGIFQIFPKHPNDDFSVDATLLNLYSSSNFYADWQNYLSDQISKFSGRSVLYDDEIQLLHVESKAFIQVKEISKMKGSSYVLELIQHISLNNYFKVTTISNFFVQGEKVFYQSKFYLKSSLINQNLILKTQNNQKEKDIPIIKKNGIID